MKMKTKKKILSLEVDGNIYKLFIRNRVYYSNFFEDVVREIEKFLKKDVEVRRWKR